MNVFLIAFSKSFQQKKTPQQKPICIFSSLKRQNFGAMSFLNSWRFVDSFISRFCNSAMKSKTIDCSFDLLQK